MQAVDFIELFFVHPKKPEDFERNPSIQLVPSSEFFTKLSTEKQRGQDASCPSKM
jgi:hypothetical protein